MLAKYKTELENILKTNAKLRKAGFKTEFVYMTIDFFGQVKSALYEDHNGTVTFDCLEVLKVRNGQSVKAEWTIAVSQ